MKTFRSALARSVSVAVLAGAMMPAAVMAQSDDTQDSSTEAQEDTGTDFLGTTIVVTGTKKAGGENVQDAPVAITAFGAEQLQALQVRDVSDLSFRMPSVSLDEVGTVKGVANFSIRGLGVNSSIPSIDPTVGVFVDGVYLGINAGVVFDTFDLAGVETLRGPQGILFGRNVTGGAVLLNTTDPQNEFQLQARVAAESGLRGTGGNYYAMGTVTGPLVEDVLSAKLAVYYNRDDGWFENTLANGDTETFGESDTFIIRGGLRLTPGDSGVDIKLKFEHGESEGDGPASQNHRNGSGIEASPLNPPGTTGRFSRESFDFSINERGSNDSEWNQLTASIDIPVDIGDGGTITNVFGWREYSQSALTDLDGTPLSLFNGEIGVDQDQISNELRFSGRFGGVLDLTAGLYYFTQDLAYAEGRRLLGVATPTGAPALTQDGGGVMDQETFGAFLAIDVDVSDSLSLNAGIRYADETKDAQIASLVFNVNAPCNVILGECAFDFVDTFSTSNWSPKIGLGYEFSPDARAYLHWARAFRAGGFNFRNTAIDTVNFGPGPFQDERIDSFEFGVKSEPGSSARLNAAVFYNRINDLQREINLADPTAGVVQVIRNTADATIFGFEIDAQVEIIEGVILEGSLGYLDGDYRNVTFDLNSDGAVNAQDEDLQIPRLAPWTGNIGIIVEQDISLGVLRFRSNYSYRERSFFTDDNLGFFNQADRVDASMSLETDSGITFTLYAQNLTNDVQHGGDTQLPAQLGPLALGGTFSPLSRGRVFGIEASFLTF